MTDWILDIIAQGGYLGIGLLMIIENIFPPIPSELIMGLGGINVAKGRMELFPLLLAGTVGTTIGNYVWFTVGDRLGYERLKPIVDRWGRWLTMDWEDVEAASHYLQKHGHWVVFAFRFSPFLRTIISLPAGLAHMSKWRFLAYTAAGAMIWNMILVGAGFYLGNNFSDIEHYTGPVALGTAAIIIAIYLWRVIRWKPRHLR